ncbi:MAG: aspartate/glutamate racemase family protein [Desulfobacterales bacterium]|nr:aspartate/glutamate racemase family protein [Desulfobacterales bacterium]
MIIDGGTNLSGIPIGILCLETYYGRPPGHIRNASTFQFPVMYRIVKGATAKRVVKQADPELLEPFIEAAQELEREGVMAITGSCGFLALFQDKLADAVNIPVFTSSLIQIPLVHSMLRRNQLVGILTASKSTLTEPHLSAVGAGAVPVCLAGMDEQPEFCEVVIEARRSDLDLDRLGEEVLAVVDRMAEIHPEMGALVIECTDLPPFAHLIQQKINIPVFDIVTLTNMVYESLIRRPFNGIMPRRGR